MSLAANLAAWGVAAVAVPAMLVKSTLGRNLAIDAGPAEPPTAGNPRRHVLSPGLRAVPSHEARTLYEVLHDGARRFKPSQRLFGARDVLRIVEEEMVVTKVVAGVETKETKVWKFFELSEYSWMTYKDAVYATQQIGAGLRKLGMKPQDKLTIFASTCRDWMLMAHACYSQSMYITTAYDTLGEEGLTFSLNECEIATLFTQADLLPMVKKIGGAVPTLKNIIYTGKATDDQINALKAAHPHLTVHSLEEVRQLGARNPVEPIPPKPEDLCCIMYTSGSTGNPKGVMLTHAAILGVVAAAELIFGPYLGDNDDVMLAFLPLAHVLEFALEHVSMYLGMAIGYGGVRTLTDSSVRNCKGDIRELRPTFMAGVPAVWETIRKGVMAKLNEAKSTQRAIFDMAFNLKWFLLQMGMPTGFLDAVVFKAVQQQTGGRLKLILSGGAPLPPESHKFMTVCVCPLVQGYGLTETCGPLSVQTMMEIGTVGTVGAPLPSVELKLVAVEETAYTPFPDDPNVNPRGEVWARGSSIMSGYYKQPQLTAEVLTDDGWFKTGDIGEWMPDGALRIIDRKKNLVKLSNGEYVAIEKLESQYKTSAFVANICIYADSLEAFVVGIVVPIEKELRTLAKSLSLFNTAQHEPDFAELCAHPEIIKKVLEDIRSAGRRANFKPAELVHTITLIPEEWTPQNGMLTAAQKIKRPEIAKKYAAAIKKMYNKKN